MEKGVLELGNDEMQNTNLDERNDERNLHNILEIQGRVHRVSDWVCLIYNCWIRTWGWVEGDGALIADEGDERRGRPRIPVSKPLTTEW